MRIPHFCDLVTQVNLFSSKAVFIFVIINKNLLTVQHKCQQTLLLSGKLTHIVSSDIAGVEQQKSRIILSRTTHDGNPLAFACQQQIMHGYQVKPDVDSCYVI